MNSSKNRFLADSFSHIYVEKDALSYEYTGAILSAFPNAHIIEINHYKDFFDRGHQDFLLQKKSQANLILAVSRGNRIYPGARMCQSFDNDNFYYTSTIRNCIYDCEYCYLQGMYPSGSIVVFVNIEDYFADVKKLTQISPLYLCVSYDTDILAMNGLFKMADKWIEFAKNTPNLTIEIRTKSAALESIKEKDIPENVIFAWTLSPDAIITRFEHHTPSLDLRIDNINNAIARGLRTRLCLDPMIYVNDYAKIYGDFYDYIFNRIDISGIFDVSLGLFRISSEYIKSMRRKRFSEITEYPYTNIDGVCSYDAKRAEEMYNFSRSCILKYIDASKLYIQ